jgi:hypothetical protein
MNSLEEKHFYTINRNIFEYAIDGERLAAKSCADITIEFAGKFAEWVTDVKGFRKYNEGWCERGGSNGWHCSTDELINEYTNQNK